MGDKVRVFVSDGCPVCQDLKDDLAALAAGGEVEVVNIDDETGFDQFAREVLDKSKNGEAGIPYAIAEGEKCQILRGQGKMALRCNGKIIGATPEEVEN